MDYKRGNVAAVANLLELTDGEQALLREWFPDTVNHDNLRMTKAAIELIGLRTVNHVRAKLNPNVPRA